VGGIHVGGRGHRLSDGRADEPTNQRNAPWQNDLNYSREYAQPTTSTDASNHKP